LAIEILLDGTGRAPPKFKEELSSTISSSPEESSSAIVIILGLSAGGKVSVMPEVQLV
jgi:hypothetical protein